MRELICYTGTHKVKARTVLILVVLAAACMCGGEAFAAPDTEILRPNGAGSSTDLSNSGCANNWECVEESTADGDTTYVYNGSNGWLADLYAVQDSSGSGTINSVTVYTRSRADQTWFIAPQARTLLRTHSQNYTGDVITLTTSWANHSTSYTTNPDTGNAWTWSEIDALEVGVRQRGFSFWFIHNQARTTQVWIEIDYTPTSGSPVTRTEWEESY